MHFHILIIEDDIAILSSLKQILEFNGHMVSTASNGAEGFKLIRENTSIPDLVITDAMMPVMNGFEFLAKLKKDPKINYLPVIMVTAKTSLESKLHGLELGADDYITKPFEFRELELKVGNLLRRQKEFRKSLILSSNETSIVSQDKLLLKKLTLLIDEALDQPEIKIDDLADRLCMSTSTFYRRVKNITGKAPVNFIREYKLKKAREMIRANYGTLSEIGYKSGFNSLAYFSRSYKEFFGKAPHEDLP